MGLERAGWSCVFANDIDPTKKKLHDAHFRDERDHYTLADVGTLKADDIPDIELATASFPCTDLSLAGRGEGLAGAQSSAFWGFIDVIERLGARGPRQLMLENVPALVTSHNGADLRRIVEALNALGYTVDLMVLNARWFVPQSRPRLFIVAERGEERTYELPTEPSMLRPRQIVEAIQSNSDLGWSISETLDPPRALASRLKNVVEKLSDANDAWWSNERRDYLRDQLSPAHAKEANTRIEKRSYTYATAFRRMRKDPSDGVVKSRAELRADGIAGCLRTPKGGSAKQILVKMGYGRFMVRYLTPRECARLMGADEFVIPDDVTDNQALFGFGDAVCVPAITWLAKHRLNPKTVPAYAV